MNILARRKVIFNNPMVFFDIPSERRYWILEYDKHMFEMLWEYRSEAIFKEL